MINNKYKLEGHKPVLCGDLFEWTSWLEKADRQVAKTILKGPNNVDILVSTVFLGLNHNYGEGKPILFETMVFGGAHDEDMKRYCTWEEAEEGHKLMVDRVKSE